MVTRYLSTGGPLLASSDMLSGVYCMPTNMWEHVHQILLKCWVNLQQDYINAW